MSQTAGQHQIGTAQPGQTVFYVSTTRSPRSGIVLLLLGPYSTPEAALADKPVAAALARDAFPRAAARPLAVTEEDAAPWALPARGFLNDDAARHWKTAG